MATDGVRALRYLDSGARAPENALGTWLQTELLQNVTELRWQSGFFSADGLAPFIPTLQRLTVARQPVRILIGSNGGDTLQADVRLLIELLGLPRSSAQFGVVSYAGAFFHPKTYHIRRDDGSEAAYVGSANLTASGIGSLHVEAGLIIDTSDGDPPEILQSISSSIDAWFREARPGLEVVTGASDVERLTTSGVLSLAPTPRAVAQSGRDPSAGPPRPRLQPLIRLPRTRRGESTANARPVPAEPLIEVTATPRRPYPEYILFQPNTAAPTIGADALSGATLPGGAAGLIIKLNQDSARHWRPDGTGTSNISIPVATLATLRFGMLTSNAPKPRAEFELHMRYVSTSRTIEASPSTTNIMAYGFGAGETGHGDVRLVVPRSPAREIAGEVTRRRLPLPVRSDVALLEWPTSQQPAFRLSLLESGSQLFERARMLLEAADASSRMVGRGACWLPSGLSPEWNE